MQIKLFTWYDWTISGAHYDDVLLYKEIPGRPQIGGAAPEEGYKAFRQNEYGWKIQPIFLIHNLSPLKVTPILSAEEQQQLILKIFRERNSL